ncbi:MAG TPA: DUF4410 domain-containing protein [candidate division Zixibacteria bacterium]|nr:DUF4410 domain-containing protein [candidate division Zixibacteria bacterium]
MKPRLLICVAVVLGLAVALGFAVEKKQEQKPRPLAGIKIVQVEPAVLANPEKIKNEFAANQVTDSLKKALRDADFELGESPIRAHIVLNEFTSGSTATRFLVGMGAGRSTVEGLLVITDKDGKELASRKIRVRGNLAWSSYQGANTQRRQAVNSFEQRLIEEIETMK